jgi:uncharacterized SAM-binding protein YcdF (DUF218 family)
MTWLYDLFQPLDLLWLLALVLLFSLWRRRQERRQRLAWLTACYLILTFACLPAVNTLALWSLERRYPPLSHRPDDVQAIVVLSGAIYPPEAEGGQPLLATDTLYRCLLAVQLYRQGRPCPVVVTGGTMPSAVPLPPMSRVMRDFLVSQGVSAKDILEESNSQSTYENAVGTAPILRAAGLHRVLLITNAPHLERAVRCFRKQGVDVVPCGCQYGSLHFHPDLINFLPDPQAAWGIGTALHEWLGLAWYAFRGRI